MLRLFLDFMKLYGRGYYSAIALLFSGAIATSFLEMLGVILIFPLIYLVNTPSAATNGPTLSVIYRFFSLSDPKYLVMLFSMGIAGIYVLRGVLLIFFMMAGQKIVSRWKSEICQNFFHRYIDADYIFHLTRSSEKSISVITDVVPNALNMFVYQMILLFSYFMVGLCLMGYLVSMYPVMTFVTGILFAAMFLAQKKLLKSKLSKTNGEYITLISRNRSALQQGIASYKETKINLKEKFFEGLFITSNRDLMKAEEKINFFNGLPVITTELITIVVVIVAFNIIMFSRTAGMEATLDLASMAMTVFRMVPVVNRMMTSMSMVHSAEDALRRLLVEHRELDLDHEPQAEGDLPPEVMTLNTALALNDLTFVYPGSVVPSLSHVSLSIGKGEFIGVIGQSGAGKSTLINVLLGFLTVEPGYFTVDGRSIDRSNVRALRRMIGFVDQQAQVFDTSIKQNVAFGEEIENIDTDLVIECLKCAELWTFVEGLEFGINSPAGEGGKNLSGGQRQRLVIARALYKRPKILILDEATSALDVETESRISAMIQSFKGDLTIIAVAHRLSTLKACDRLILMEQGKIVQDAPFEELLATNETFQALVKMTNMSEESLAEA